MTAIDFTAHRNRATHLAESFADHADYTAAGHMLAAAGQIVLTDYAAALAEIHAAREAASSDRRRQKAQDLYLALSIDATYAEAQPAR
jgi:hypothetical protein